MRVIDITMPLWDGMPMGSVFPQERGFKVEVMNPEFMPALVSLEMFCEPGTRYVCSTPEMEAGIMDTAKTDIIGKLADRWKHFTQFHTTLAVPLKFFDWCNNWPF